MTPERIADLVKQCRMRAAYLKDMDYLPPRGGLVHVKETLEAAADTLSTSPLAEGVTEERIAEIKARLEAVTTHYGLKWAYESCGEKGDGSNIVGTMFHPDDENAERPLVGFCEPFYNEETHEFRDYYRDEQIAEIEHRSRASGQIAEFICQAPQDISDLLCALASKPIAGVDDEMHWRKVFARQDAIHLFAQSLQCPKCGSDQNQIMNQAVLGADFEWRCRMCKYKFISGATGLAKPTPIAAPDEAELRGILAEEFRHLAIDPSQPDQWRIAGELACVKAMQRVAAMTHLRPTSTEWDAPEEGRALHKPPTGAKPQKEPEIS